MVKSFFGARKWTLWISLIILFGFGLAIRLYDLTDPPLDFHATRQLHSVLMARGMYYENLVGIPDWQRQAAVEMWKAEGLIEPPIMERLTAFTYQLAGGEYLWIPRLYSIFFWLLGGMALFLLARDLSGIDGGIVALAYYLFIPYGAIASRAFQPDPILTMAIIFALWAGNKWYKNPSWRWAIVAGLLSGFAILIKSTAVFFIGGAWVGLVLASAGIRKAIKNPQVWVIALLTITPYAIFHIYGVYITGLLTSQFSLRFFPRLWIDPVFYLRWNGQLSSVLGFEWFLLSLIGLLAFRDRIHRYLLLGIWVGYFLYGMTLSFHISTHDYYQLPAIPIVGLGLAAGADVLLRNLRGPKWLLFSTVLGVVLFSVVIKGWDVRVTLKRNDYRNEPLIWQQIGAKLGQDSSVIGLTHDYGYRLEYWGWKRVTNWMTVGDMDYRVLAGQTFDINALFKEQAEGKDYFVVTLLGELDAQPDLKQLLYDNYPILEKSDDYIIFDLQHPFKSTSWLWKNTCLLPS